MWIGRSIGGGRGAGGGEEKIADCQCAESSEDDERGDGEGLLLV